MFLIHMVYNKHMLFLLQIPYNEIKLMDQWCGSLFSKFASLQSSSVF